HVSVFFLLVRKGANVCLRKTPLLRGFAFFVVFLRVLIYIEIVLGEANIFLQSRLERVSDSTHIKT
ncbi:MAG: hypothetical protein AAB491_01215, partial [Patescibacteria group bacterium]